MDSLDVFGLLFALFLLVGSFGFTYRLGRVHERKALTAALVSQTKDIYFDGYGDAAKDCRNGDIK